MNQIENCISSIGIVGEIIMIVLGIILVVNSFKLKDDGDDSWWACLIGGIVVFFLGVLTMILAYKYPSIIHLLEV